MGYDTETNYDFGYFSFLNLYLTRFRFISKGVAFPEIGPDFNACELGFGNGVSIVMHAVNSPAQWYGNDFNPSQVGFAQMMANTAQTKVHLTDDAFDQYLEREDLPMFDFICLHGIFSWISEENQNIIVEFIKRHLKIGGVLYISYNIGAGFGPLEPFRYLMYTYSNTMSDPALNHVKNLPNILEFIDNLLELNPRYTAHAPWLKGLYEDRIKKNEYNYVSHEYLNGNWFLFNFNDVAQKLEPAKLNFVCQARMVDDMDEFFLKEGEAEFLEPFKGTALYQPIRDYISCQTFRSDLYVKGVRTLNEHELIQEMDKTYFVLAQDPNAKELVINTRKGNNNVDIKRLQGLFKLMDDFEVHSFKELRQALCKEYAAKPLKGIKLISVDELLDIINYAVTCSIVLVAVPPHEITQEIIDNSSKLNDAILHAHLPANILALSSPVLGGGFVIDNIHKLLLNVIESRPDLTEAQMVEVLLELNKSGNNMVLVKRKDTEVNSLKQQKEIIKSFVHDFMTVRLPLMRKLCYI